MQKVKVLQGCSICEGGIWYSQGAVLLVADAAIHFRMDDLGDGKVVKVPLVEIGSDEPVNTPEGLLPKAVEASESPVPDLQPLDQAPKEEV